MQTTISGSRGETLQSSYLTPKVQQQHVRAASQQQHYQEVVQSRSFNNSTGPVVTKHVSDLKTRKHSRGQAYATILKIYS